MLYILAQLFTTCISYAFCIFSTIQSSTHCPKEKVGVNMHRTVFVWTRLKIALVTIKNLYASNARAYSSITLPQNTSSNLSSLIPSGLRTCSRFVHRMCVVIRSFPSTSRLRASFARPINGFNCFRYSFYGQYK